MPRRRSRHVLAVATLVGASASSCGSAVAGPEAPAPKTVRDGVIATGIDQLRGGPAVVHDLATAWVEEHDGVWRLRLAPSPGEQTKTIARGKLSHDEDDDSGEIYDESVGAVAIAGDLAVIELQTRAGSTKYDQYQRTATVTAYSLSTGTATQLATCSAHEDGFNGPSLVPVPAATLATDGDAVSVALCGKTQIFKPAQRAAAIATLPADVFPTALAGELVVAGTVGPAYRVLGWVDGVERYRVTVPSPKLQSSGIALRADGATAVVINPDPEGEQCLGTVTWHTPAAPTGVALRSGVCGFTPAIGSSGAVVETAVTPQVGAHERRELRLVAPGAPPTDAPLASYGGPFGTHPVGVVDHDVAYRVRSCGGDVIARATTTSGSPATACPGLVVRQAKLTGRKLRLRVDLADATTAPLTVTFRARGHVIRKAWRVRGGSAGRTFTLPPWARGAGVRDHLALSYPGDELHIPQRVTR